jgi:hypothetical protein
MSPWCAAWQLISPGLLKKYRQIPVCKAFLLNAKGTIAEASPDHLGADGTRTLVLQKWTVLNVMGHLLEDVRDTLL